MKRWSLKYECCVICGTTKIRHYGAGHCFSCDKKLRKPIRDKKYRETHKKQLQEYFKIHYRENIEHKQAYDCERRSKLRFNGADKIALERANYKCEHCGISNEEQIKKVGCRLNVHHKDNNGRKSIRAGLYLNNEVDNLVVLCQSCHTIEGNKNIQNYSDGRMDKAWKTRRNKAEQIKL